MITRTLFDAIDDKNYKEIETLIKKGADLTAIDDDHYTPIEYAALVKKDSEATYIIAKFGKENESGTTNFGRILAHAVKDKDLLLAHTLIIAKAHYYWTTNSHYCEHWAAKNNDINMLELLVKNNFDMTRKNKLIQTPLELACEDGSWKAAQFLIEHEIKKTGNKKIERPHFIKALEIAVRKNDFFTANLLLTQNTTATATDSEHGHILLFYAVSNNNTDMIKLLLKYGADSLVEDGKAKNTLDLARKLNFKESLSALEDDIRTKESQWANHATLSATTFLMTTAQVAQSLLYPLSQNDIKLRNALIDLKNEIEKTLLPKKTITGWEMGTPTHAITIKDLISQMNIIDSANIRQTYDKVLAELRTAQDKNWFEKTLNIKTKQQHLTTTIWYENAERNLMSILTGTNPNQFYQECNTQIQYNVPAPAYIDPNAVLTPSSNSNTFYYYQEPPQANAPVIQLQPVYTPTPGINTF